MESELPSEASHISRRSDILTVALAVLCLGVPVILGPEWGIPLVVCGVAGLIVYSLLWKDKNPPWLQSALIGLFVLFLLTSGSVLAWKLLRPLPTLASRLATPAVPSDQELTAEFAKVWFRYRALHQEHTITATNNNAHNGIANSGTIGKATVIDNSGASTVAPAQIVINAPTQFAGITNGVFNDNLMVVEGATQHHFSHREEVITPPSDIKKSTVLKIHVTTDRATSGIAVLLSPPGGLAFFFNPSLANNVVSTPLIEFTHVRQGQLMIENEIGVHFLSPTVIGPGEEFTLSAELQGGVSVVDVYDLHFIKPPPVP